MMRLLRRKRTYKGKAGQFWAARAAAEKLAMDARVEFPPFHVSRAHIYLEPAANDSGLVEWTVGQSARYGTVEEAIAAAHWILETFEE